MGKTLVTAALPYANGPLHIGHIAGAYLPADIYVRYLRLKGEEAAFICGTDEHGVPITLAAEKGKITPREFVDGIHRQMKTTFEKLGISFDNFSGTARPLHYKTASEFFLSLNVKNHLEKKTVQQLFCVNDGRFLPDRYVEGTCPKCGAPGARGDQCESCGNDLEPTELLNPLCKICGQKPVLKETFHWFFKLSSFEEKLKGWLEGKKGVWKENVVNFSLGLLGEGLPDRPITRDMEWGIPVPLAEGKGKVIYVWFDAPIGYISATMEWAEKKGTPDLWKSYWQGPDAKIVHFIGKDNIVFHALLWPAMLMGEGANALPHQIPANEFLNLNGKKLSTSRGYAIWVHEFLEKFPADALRYYLATIAPEAKDSDFVLKEFQAIYNGEMADILGNLVNRVTTFVHRYFDGKVPPPGTPGAATEALLQDFKEAAGRMAGAFEAFEVRKAAGIFMNTARAANKYFNDQAPWKSRKEDPARCTEALNACLFVIKGLSVAGEPLVPAAAAKIRALFTWRGPLTWASMAEAPEPGSPLGPAEVLFAKIEDEAIAAEQEKLERLAP